MRKTRTIPTSLGTVNIRELVDLKGRNVVSIEVIPDEYIGEKKIRLSGRSNTRLIQLKNTFNGTAFK
jgi:hypothetical protein